MSSFNSIVGFWGFFIFKNNNLLSRSVLGVLTAYKNLFHAETFFLVCFFLWDATSSCGCLSCTNSEWAVKCAVDGSFVTFSLVCLLFVSVCFNWGLHGQLRTHARAHAHGRGQSYWGSAVLEVGQHKIVVCKLLWSKRGSLKDNSK